MCLISGGLNWQGVHKQLMLNYDRVRMPVPLITAQHGLSTSGFPDRDLLKGCIA